ncbi:MAG: methyl-accepting chemotaxis protein [Candidatus Marinimicrobia bacterium]|nr:methyl-accepting chemotaxis protein [Candidatus Neomarinimicrobiota bacterium]
MFKKSIQYINNSLERRIPLAIFLVLMLVLGTSFFLLIQRQRQIDSEVKLENVHQTAALIHRCIDYSMLTGDMEGAEEILLRAAEDPMIHSVRLFNADLEEVISTDENKHKYDIQDQLRNVKKTKIPMADNRYMHDGRLAFFDPVLLSNECLECHEGSIGEIVGVLETDVDTQDLIARYKDNQFLLSSVAWIIVLIIGGILFFLIHRMVVFPIKLVSQSIHEIATGEGDLTRLLEVKTMDELGELSAGFNIFIKKLRSMITDLIKIGKTIGDTSKAVVNSTELLAAGAEEQQSQLSEVATSMEEMSAMILETSNNAVETQSSAGEANLASKEGQTTVENTIQGIEGISRIVNAASEQIGALKGRSEEISMVIQVIDEIADQTNLLALNANIEAARAGDAGRGFAVVADEVRKLAERTVKATADIGEKIKHVQTDVNEAVEAMSNIKIQSGEGQKMAGAAGAALKQISESIDRVNFAISQITSAANEQSSGVEQISKNVEQVSSVSKQSATSAQELATASDQLNSDVQSLERLLGQFKV